MSQTIATGFEGENSREEKLVFTDTIILIRTHYMDDDLAELIENFQQGSGYSVVLAADERNAPVDIGPANGKISLTLERYSELGLHITDDVMWRCGDYPLYLAIKNYPNTKFFWMIEPDVHINLDSPGLFFKKFSENTDVDFIAAQYGPRNKEWWWFQSMSPYATNIYGCLYPITRVSRSAIMFLLDKRKIYSAAHVAASEKQQEDRTIDWPNDEAFTSTTLSNGPFLCRDLNEFGNNYRSDDTISHNCPILRKCLLERRRDGLVYHPVLSGERFLRKAYSILEQYIWDGAAPEAFESKFGISFQRKIADECGDEAARNFKARYDIGLALCQQRRQADPA